MVKKNKRRCSRFLYGFINIFFPLFLGGILYVLFKPDSFVVIWFTDLFENSFVPSFPSALYSASPILCFSRNHLADILWAYSFTNALLLVGCPVFHEHELLAVSIIISALLEAVQVFIPSLVFDFMDILLEIVGILTAWLVYKTVLR